MKKKKNQPTNQVYVYHRGLVHVFTWMPTEGSRIFGGQFYSRVKVKCVSFDHGTFLLRVYHSNIYIIQMYICVCIHIYVCVHIYNMCLLVYQQK